MLLRSPMWQQENKNLRALEVAEKASLWAQDKQEDGGGKGGTECAEVREETVLIKDTGTKIICLRGNNVPSQLGTPQLVSHNSYKPELLFINLLNQAEVYNRYKEVLGENYDV